MGNLFEMGYLTEIPCGKNLSYVLEDASQFSNIDYKVLQSNENSSLVRCMKMLYNGKLQLYYIISGYRTLNSLVSTLDAEGFISVIASVFQSIAEVKKNGFLKCENIDISMDHIFIDPTTHKAYLMYFPILGVMNSDESYFETDLRSSFAKLILSLPALSTQKTMQLLANLQNMVIPLERIFENVLHEKGDQAKTENKPIVTKQPSEIRFISINSKEMISLLMNKNPYVIGRSLKHADGIIRDNKMVGRAHCRISISPDGCDVEDLESANGTYVNQVRIPTGGHAILKNGDILRLANVDLQVIIKWAENK